MPIRRSSAVKPLGRVDNAWMCKPGFVTGKKTLRLQTRLDLEKALEQGALPCPAHGLDDQLQLAALLVHPQTGL